MQTQSSTHLAIARKHSPGLSERFNLFVKEREHSQASESDNSGEGAKDLVSIVEFQVCLSMATMHPAAQLIYRCYIYICKCLARQCCGREHICLAVQTNLKQVLQAHSDTLRDIRGFWRELCNKKTTFASLSEVTFGHTWLLLCLWAQYDGFCSYF